jgi:hypothetical protein
VGPDVFLVTSDRSQAIAPVDELLVCATGSAAMTAQGMHERIDLMVSYRGAGGRIRGILQYSPEQVIPTELRAIIVQRGDEADLASIRRLALLSSSILIRGAATAIGWLSRGTMRTRAFEPSHWRTALVWLEEVARFDVKEAERALRRVAAAVGVPTLP